VSALLGQDNCDLGSLPPRMLSAWLDEWLRRGRGEVRASASVVENLAGELTNGVGLGIMLRDIGEDLGPGRDGRARVGSPALHPAG